MNGMNAVVILKSSFSNTSSLGQVVHVTLNLFKVAACNSTGVAEEVRYKIYVLALIMSSIRCSRSVSTFVDNLDSITNLL